MEDYCVRPTFDVTAMRKHPKSLSDDACYPGIVKAGTRHLGTVKVVYPFHPLFDQEVRAVQCDAKGRKGQLLVETSQDRQCLPAWMTEPTRCALLTFGWQPFVSEQALRQLDALLASLDQHDPPPKLNS